LYSPCYASTIYRYRIQGEGSLFLKNEGILVVSVFGIYLYEDSTFKKPKIYVEFEDIQNLEVKVNHVSIEFIEEKTQSIKTLKVHSPMKNDIAYDIVSYMQI